MKKSIIILFLLCILTSLRAQEGYDITISIENVPDKMLYLVGFYGDNAILFDSVKVKHKSDFYFKNNKGKMPSGIYWLINKNRDVYMELLVDKDRHFTIKTTMDQLWNWREMTNTEENKVFFGYQLRAAYAEDVHELVQEFVDRSPESLLAKYLKAKYLSDNVSKALATEPDDADVAELGW